MFLTLTVMAFILMGDALRDALDPRQRPDDHPSRVRPASRRLRDPLLEVDDLRWSSAPAPGVVNAVNGISYTVGYGETLGDPRRVRVGQVGVRPGDHGHPGHPAGSDPQGAIWFEGRGPADPAEEEQRRVRGAGISMIFQDALSSLNPVYSVGFQIGEMFRAAPRGRRARRPSSRPSS